jgi:hypothetical protein
MKRGANGAYPSHYLEKDFFEGAVALRAQLEQACAESSGDGVGPLSRVEAGKAYSFLMATAERVFPHALVLSFLSRLRGWGLEHLGARHASTPQIHVYLDGCGRAMAPDATPAGHHYLYSLTRAEPARLHILGGGRRSWLGIGVSHLAGVRLDFNNLLVHSTDLAYAVDGPRGARSAVGATVFLHGYIW